MNSKYFLISTSVMLLAILIFGITKANSGVLATFNYTAPRTELAGFRLYADGELICSIADPTITAISCETYKIPFGFSNFTMTAYNVEGIESKHSLPFTYEYHALIPLAPGITGVRGN